MEHGKPGMEHGKPGMGAKGLIEIEEQCALHAMQVKPQL